MFLFFFLQLFSGVVASVRAEERLQLVGQLNQSFERLLGPKSSNNTSFIGTSLSSFFLPFSLFYFLISFLFSLSPSLYHV
jgi:hypothetical protein